MGKYCIGVDVGGTSVKLGLFTTEGELLEKWEIPTRKENNGSKIIGDVADSIGQKMEQKQIDRTDVCGIGMGVPGPTMADGHVIKCVNLGWSECDPAKELGEMLGIHVKIGNDANVAALGEMWKGGGKGHDDVVMLTLGTGVGGGVILGGSMVAGKRGIGGELGHITVNPNETERCNCGNCGCLEQYASATGVVRVARKLMEEGKEETALAKLEVITAKDVFDLARNGDPVAGKAVEILGQYLGLVMANVSLTVDPDVFVIGGGVSRAGEILIQVIEKYYRNYLCITSDRADVVLAQLGNEAGIYGAAKLAL